MLFAISEKDGSAPAKFSGRTATCVAAICGLAAAPLIVSFTLTVFGG